MYSLHAASTTFMRYSLDLVATPVPGRTDHQHISQRKITGRIPYAGIKFAGALLQNYGGKGTERLTKLDAGIDNILHLRPSRIGQDGSVPKRPRSPFKAILKKSDHLACQHIIHHQLSPALGILDALVRTSSGFNGTFRFLSRIGLSPVGMLHDELPRFA